MKLSRWSIADACAIIASCMLGILISIAVIAVFLRYAMGRPLAWAEEIEIFTLLWTIMTGAVYAKKQKTLLRVDILVNLMPPRVQHLLSIISELLHVGIFCLMIYYGYNLAMQLGTKSMPLLGIPLKWLYISLPVGAFGMLVVTIFQLYDLITNKEVS